MRFYLDLFEVYLNFWDLFEFIGIYIKENNFFFLAGHNLQSGPFPFSARELPRLPLLSLPCGAALSALPVIPFPLRCAAPWGPLVSGLFPSLAVIPGPLAGAPLLLPRARRLPERLPVTPAVPSFHFPAALVSSALIRFVWNSPSALTTHSTLFWTL